MLLLSGAGTDNAELSWARLLPELAQQRQVYALDWPKQGGSRPWEGLAEHGSLLRCVEAVLEHYRLERVDLVGLSQGGAMALATTIEHPDRVRRLVAMAPGGILPPFGPVIHQLLWLTAKAPLLNRTLPSLLFTNRAATRWFLKKALFAGPVEDFEEIEDQVIAEVRSSGATSSDWQNNSIGPFSMKVDLRPRLHSINCPTLFIQGSEDIGIAPKHTRAAAELVPGARLEMIAGAGHWVQRQEPARVNRLILDFLAE